MAPIGPGHSGHTMRLTSLFTSRLGGRVIVSVQNPIILSRYGEPQPDVVLLRPRPDCYTTSHPTPGDVLLVVEVSDTTLAYDRDVKVPLYAAAGILEVWLVDLQGRRVLVYRQPVDGTYRDVRGVEQGTLSPVAFPELVIRLDEILG